jgi:hypothetical protein
VLRRGTFVLWFMTCLHVQLGIGYYEFVGLPTYRSTPVAVSGLSSGVAMVALGGVRLSLTAALLMLV